MKARIMKKIAVALSFLGLVFLSGCARNMESGDMGNTMNSMEEKPMMEMQEQDRMESMDEMKEMKNDSSMEKTSAKQTDGMDKMMK